MNYYRAEENRIICLLCHHYCHLKEGQVGLCGANQNRQMKLHSLVFGHPIALHVDPIEKKPLYHFLPASKALSLGTIGCNFRCSFCQNWSISQSKNVRQEKSIEPQAVIEMALRYECASIAYTYNEPTIFYPYAKEIALLAHKHGIKNIFVTNGYASAEVIADMKGIIDAVNIDIKSFNQEYYKKSLGGKLEHVLENAIMLKEAGIWIEVTTLIVPTKNDSHRELHAIASFIKEKLGADTPWHLSAFHPDYHETFLPNTPLKTLQEAERIGKEVGLNFVYIGNAGVRNKTICPHCQQLVLERRGFEITEHTLEDGCCPKCHERIAGVFDEI